MRKNKINREYESPLSHIVHVKLEGVLCVSGTDYNEGGSFGDSDSSTKSYGVIGSL